MLKGILLFLPLSLSVLHGIPESVLLIVKRLKDNRVEFACS